MDFRTAHVCEGSDCLHRASVYLTCLSEPALGAWLEYTCPKCRRPNVFRLVAMIVVRETPRNALVARASDSPSIETCEDALAP
jgi:hypothetical protein